MVEGAGLENRRLVKNGSGGSNPSPSATFKMNMGSLSA